MRWVAHSAGSTRSATLHVQSRVAPPHSLNWRASRIRPFPEADVLSVSEAGTPNSSCHLAAFFRAALTCLCAVLTILRLVFCAFIAAGLTNFGAVRRSVRQTPNRSPSSALQSRILWRRRDPVRCSAPSFSHPAHAGIPVAQCSQATMQSLHTSIQL